MSHVCNTLYTRFMLLQGAYFLCSPKEQIFYALQRAYFGQMVTASIAVGWDLQHPNFNG